MEVRLSLRLTLQKVIHLFLGEEVVAVVNWLVATEGFKVSKDWGVAGAQIQVVGRLQIGVDVGDGAAFSSCV